MPAFRTFQPKRPLKSCLLMSVVVKDFQPELFPKGCFVRIWDIQFTIILDEKAMNNLNFINYVIVNIIMNNNFRFSIRINISLKKYLAYSLYILSYLLSGCAASGPMFNKNKNSVEPEMSRIIIYNELSGSFVIPHISINENTIGLLRRGGYLIHDAYPGTHSLGTLRSDGSFSYVKKITLKKNTTTYFKYKYRGKLIEYISSCGVTDNTVIVCRKKNYQPTLDLVEERIALEELSKLKLSLD